MNLSIQINEDGLHVEATDLHPIDYDNAARLVRDLTADLHRTLASADTDGA